jgi:hypothetical protein
MRAVIAVACLGLLAWPAGAEEPTHSLTVSRHPSVRDFSENEIKQLLRKASAVMHAAGCPVTFTLDGAVRTFSSASVPNNVVTTADVDKVHSEPTNVKIVKEIHCCVDKKNEPGKRFEGCSWPPKEGSRSIILTETGAGLGNRWAHEFGHRMGLPHRPEQNALMTGGGVSTSAIKVTKAECDCFLHEGKCHLPPQQPPTEAEKCPQ